MKCETAYLQNRNELAKFIDVLKAEKVRSYLEIGCKFGGSLWAVANALPKGSRIVAVDLPHGDESFKVTLPPLQECVAELINRDYAATLIVGDSTDPAVINQVVELGPYDACLIDANHTEKYIRSDWHFYGPLCRMVAFHDINHTKPIEPHKMPIEVPKVWNEIKTNYRHQEIKLDSRHNGIGVLWRA